MVQAAGPLWLRTVIDLPANERSLLPGPVYTPSATTTVSPGAAAAMAAWMVGYWAGTWRSLAKVAVEQAKRAAPAERTVRGRARAVLRAIDCLQKGLAG